MAQMYPPASHKPRPDSEVSVSKLLSSLPKDWHVFQSVFWQSQRKGRQGDGEADFLLLHKDVGIIVVEVKGGGIDIKDGIWWSTGKNGTKEIKNPFEQASDSKYSLVGFLKDLKLGFVPVMHAVAFPNQSEDASIGVYGSREIIWYRNDLGDIGQCLKRTVAHWGAKCTIADGQILTIKELLAPTKTIRKKLLDVIGDVNEQLIDLTEQQVNAFYQIRKNRRVLITGGAGTGKTILAVERTKQLLRDGFSPLLVCYNELLAQYLKAQVPDAEVHTYHALCFREAGKARIKLPTPLDKNWWEDQAPEILVEAASQNGTVFDSVVIDEGQDFSTKWHDSLLLLCASASDPPVYIFTDDRQDLYKRQLRPKDGYFEYELSVNCRNTNEIAHAVSSLFGETVNTLGVSGPVPVFHDLDIRRDGIDFMQTLVARLIKKDFVLPHQITILADDASFIDRLRQTLVEDVAFTEWSKKGVTCETIKRFKGLENDIVIVALTKSTYPQEGLEELYVAFSRPKSALLVCGNPKLRSLVTIKNLSSGKIAPLSK